ncbi:tetratricopeptide repeat protein [Marilutibacter spongiae]|uniref:Tetratricopeptide repeat protein n=1 Tax=Marilutibacter spongiae TaxID=2025720 RepID=A0A7W3Y773_9GAMM|nr:tetratricopeptide repeat protein [Lysobacter spongiae]MBB1061997.1 tetratricopeptide repeat protein [Lysobacter spongiae]
MEMNQRIRVVACAALVLLAGGCAGGAATRAVTPAPQEDLVVLEQRADAAYRNGDDETAAVLYRDLVEAMPAEGEYWYRLGNALFRRANYEDASIAYRQVLAVDPANAKAWHNLGVVRVHQAQAAFAAGVQNAGEGGDVFDESLRLSTSLYSLMDESRDAGPPPGPSATEPARSTATEPNAMGR